MKLEKVGIVMHCHLKAARPRGSLSGLFLAKLLLYVCTETAISKLPVKILSPSLA